MLIPTLPPVRLTTSFLRALVIRLNFLNIKYVVKQNTLDEMILTSAPTGIPVSAPRNNQYKNERRKIIATMPQGPTKTLEIKITPSLASNLRNGGKNGKGKSKNIKTTATADNIAMCTMRCVLFLFI